MTLYNYDGTPVPNQPVFVKPVHLRSGADGYGDAEVWCDEDFTTNYSRDLEKCTCLPCLLTCAEYGSEARHRYEVLRESGVKP